MVVMKPDEKTFFINRKKPVVGPHLICKIIYVGTGSAPACHGKLSEFESRPPSKIKKNRLHDQRSGQHLQSPLKKFKKLLVETSINLVCILPYSLVNVVRKK